ncbi:MAG: hypothetical protein AVDCRST_MAG13-1791, partial [uncultured Solirubrobacteraceae bacterium]
AGAPGGYPRGHDAHPLPTLRRQAALRHGPRRGGLLPRRPRLLPHLPQRPARGRLRRPRRVRPPQLPAAAPALLL